MFNKSLAIMVGLCILSIVVSVMTRQTRVLLAATPVFGILTLFVNLPYMLKRWPRITKTASALLFFLVMSSAIIFTSSSPPDADSIRNAYTRRLHSFVGTNYIWGGETHVGIDCSGLARTALWEAMVFRGIAERNPRLLGPVLWKFWWRDISARAMLEQKYGYTRPVGHALRLSDSRSISMNEGYSLQEGDLAVTDNGVHVMIYVGNGDWIEANPDDGKVVVNRAEGSRRTYFTMPVTLLRWWILDD